MRVLMTSDCVGGVFPYATTLCRGLADHGVEVTLAITGGEMSDSQRRDAAALRNVELRHEPYRCEWMQPPLAEVAAAGDWLEGLVADVRPDVVHLNDYAHGDRELGGRPRVVVCHSDVISWHRAVLGTDPDASWDGYREAVARGLAGADTVVAPTRAVLDGMAAWLGESGRVPAAAAAASGIVIFNAVEDAVASAIDRERFALAAGRVWDEAKGIATLAEAAAGLDWPVRVAGDATHPDGGTAAFANVELLGPLPRGELRRLMGRAAIYALPARYEPFGLSAVEAALGGCALVLGDIPTLREVWADAATFVPPGDAGAWRATLDALARDAARRQRLADAAMNRARTFTVERQAAEYDGLYRRLVSDETRRGEEAKGREGPRVW